MYFKVVSLALSGLEAVFVTVETDVSDGMPMMELVGYLSGEVKEAKERVRTAIRNCGYDWPVKRITVNISPASIRKQGAAFDLPIAVSLLGCMGIIEKNALEGACIFGELSLFGEVLPITGVLPRVMHARDMGYTKIIVPKGNEKEGALVKGIDVYGVASVQEVIDFLGGKINLMPHPCELDTLIEHEYSKELDFADVEGQAVVKRGMEIAAAGHHNILISGPPGAGKTMAARRLPSILPPLLKEECLELTKVYSVAEKLPEEGIIVKRPFVAPHHTSTAQALSGGGIIPRPGAVTLAHKAVLFLDELPEFRKNVLEVLRQPIEDKVVNIARANGNYTFPADFLLVCAMNPCPCGYYPDRRRCSCNDKMIQNYIGKISGPLLDRIDLRVTAQEVKFEELSKHGKNETSDEIRKRVIAAREVQKERLKAEKILTNGQMDAKQTTKYCKIDPALEKTMESIFKKLQLSARSYHRILKVARTIADLDDSPKIEEKHLVEAISYRAL